MINSKSHELNIVSSQVTKAQEYHNLHQRINSGGLNKNDLAVSVMAVEEEKDKITKDLGLMRKLYTMLNCGMDDAEHYGLDNSMECFRSVEDRLV